MATPCSEDTIRIKGARTIFAHFASISTVTFPTASQPFLSGHLLAHIQAHLHWARGKAPRYALPRRIVRPIAKKTRASGARTGREAYPTVILYSWLNTES